MCVLDTISDLVGKVVRKARKPWITQKKLSIKWMKGSSVKMSTTKNEVRTTEV